MKSTTVVVNAAFNNSRFKSIRKSSKKQYVSKTYGTIKSDKLKFKGYGLTRQGYNPISDKPNQDCFVISEFEIQGKILKFYAVADGHGSKGHLVSKMALESIQAKYEEVLKEHGSSQLSIQKMEDALTFAFVDTQSDLEDSRINDRSSGTTVVLASIWNNILVMANIGDSRGLLISKSHSKFNVSIKTTDHNPANQTEKRRILNSNGKIARIKDGNESYGPLRVWSEGMKTPGLAMTRSIGDTLAKSLGVICEPEFYVKVLDKNDKFIVMGSDGIWDAYSNKHAISTVLHYYSWNQIKKGCLVMVDDATDYWEENEEMRDDITCLLVFIH